MVSKQMENEFTNLFAQYVELGVSNILRIFHI